MTDKERKIAIRKLRTENDMLRLENCKLKEQIKALKAKEPQIKD